MVSGAVTLKYRGDKSPMLIGVISDTHDNLSAIDLSIEILNSKDIDLVIHGGDMISPFAAARFKSLNAPLKAVYGNNDGDRRLLSLRMKEMGGEIDDFLDFELDGKRIAVYHGTIESIQQSLILGGKYQVLVTGHTHRPDIGSDGETIVINPGEVCGYLSGKRSIAILDTSSTGAEILYF